MYDADEQAEAVYYYPREIETKAKFDITLSWNLTQLPLNQQKSSALVKKKNDKKRQKKNRNADRAAQLGIKRYETIHHFMGIQHDVPVIICPVWY